MAPRARTAQCPVCFKEFKAQGISGHIKSCQKKSIPKEGAETFDAVAHDLADQARQRHETFLATANSLVPGPSQQTDDDFRNPLPLEEPNNNFDELDNNNPPLGLEAEVEHVAVPHPVEPQPDVVPEPRSIVREILDTLPPPIPILASDHISIEFHPTSEKPPKIIPNNQYAPLTYHCNKDPENVPKIDETPWHPFSTRLDFEVAELALATHMNKAQTNTLLRLLHQCAAKPEDLTIKTATQLNKVWDLARTYRATGFERKEYKVPYKGEDIQYEIYVRPLIHWCTELLRNPFLFPKFKWNAERHVKVSTSPGPGPGMTQSKERLIFEPWTADAWWKIQERLPKGARPFCIILYADKTRLSSFGTAKAYPVIARCANLPTDIRNGSGVGGGRLVGWLPIVEEDSGESAKKLFVNFKRVVWHKGFYEILVSIKEYAKTGYHFKCAEDLILWLFFFILILSADYEEQCVMALIRGATGNFPCPICLVPHDSLGDLTVTYPLRSTQEMRTIYKDSQEMNAKNREVTLKEVGLRDVENVFWDMNGSDVYSALSWDRLHAYHGGLFSDHLWPEFKSAIEALPESRICSKTVDNQFDLVPRWPGLNHFGSVIKTAEFADGSKYEDMGKLIVFSSHNILNEQDSPRGYCLLKLLRSFLELDMYSSLTIHTDSTIAGISAELITFGAILEEYIELHPAKNWNFPKNHSHIHMVRDILEKGVTRNMNTKPNEKAHGILKLFYRFHTNFKDVAPQILKLNEEDLIAMLIRMSIDFLDEEAAEKAAAENLKSADDSGPDLVTNQSARPGLNPGDLNTSTEKLVTLASIGDEISLQAFQNSHSQDHAFDRFRTKLGQYLAGRAQVNVRLTAESKITPYHLARIKYKSVIDWTDQRDLVRSSPSFHGERRNDYVLVKVNQNQHTIGQLLTLFRITIGDTTQEIAHILPFDGSIDRRLELARRRDKDLRFIRVRVRRRVESVLVDLQRLERGCLLVQDYGNDPNDFIVIGVTDQDMWWRFKLVKLGTNLNL